VSKGPYLTQRSDTPNWFIRGTDNSGRPVFKSTKTADRAIAEAILTQYKARLLTEFVHGKEAVTTFREGAEAYIASGGEKQYLFRERADGSVTGLIPYFGDTVMNSISQTDLDKAAKELCRPGASRDTLIRNVYTPFIAVWNFCSLESRKLAFPRRWERPRQIKGTGASRLIKSRSGASPVTYERAWQFISAMSPAPAMLFTNFFYTGMRPIEAYALDVDQVDVAGRWIVVLDSKTGEPRGVPMHEMLVPLYTALVERGGNGAGRRVFLNRHGNPYPITTDEKKGQMKNAISGARGRLRAEHERQIRAGGKITTHPIDDVSTYTGRHTVSTQLVIAGVHPYLKDQILGHAVDDMSRRYTNVPQAPLIEAINKLPTIPAWQDAEWLNDPLYWQGKLLRWENYGRGGKPSDMQEAA
jgi:integrase